MTVVSIEDSGGGVVCDRTWFMRFPIDAVFLSAELEVLAVRGSLPPWRMAGARGARAVLELAAGEAERRGVRPGSHLRIAADHA